jgi:hypothetical protein
MRYAFLVVIFLGSFSARLLTAQNEPWLSHYRGNIAAETEMAYLDNFAIQIMHEPDLIGYILVYSGEDSCRGEAEARALRMKKYLLEVRGVPWNKVMWKHAGRYTGIGVEVFHLGVPRSGLAKIDFPYEPPPEGHKIPRCSKRKQRRG